MTTLAEMTLEEQRLAKVVAGARGTIEEKVKHLAGIGVFERYCEVHRRYTELARGGDVEALRRAAFLQWISMVEPRAFTGVGDLDAAATRETTDLLERMCHGGSVDAQLRWMLPYYTMIADYWFDAARAPALAKFCGINRPPGPVAAPVDFEHENRGQLGDYWVSINRGS